MDEVRHIAYILSCPRQCLHVDFIHVDFPYIVGVFHRICQGNVCLHILIKNRDILRQIFQNAFRAEHFFRQRFQEQLLYFNTSFVPCRILSETDQLFRLFAVEGLQARIQMDIQILCRVFVVHILGHIHFYAAYSVYNLAERIQVNFDIVVDVDAQQVFNLQYRILAAVVFVAVRMDGIEFCYLIIYPSGFFIVFRNFITDRYPRVTRQRKQIQTFVGTFIMDHEHNVCTLSFFIRPKNSHIQLDIPSQHGIQQIQIGTAAHISAKGRFACHFVISEGCAA